MRTTRPLLVERLEDRAVPAVWVAGSEPGTPGTAALIDAATGRAVHTLAPFGGFTGGVNVAVGDVTGDTVPDLIAAAGPGGGPHVRVFDGATGAAVRDWFAFADAFAGGVVVAAGDVNADGFADVIAGAATGGPHVRVFDGKTLAELRSLFAFEDTFAGGVALAATDLNGDGRSDVVVGAGTGGAPRVRAFSGATGAELFNRFVFDNTFRGGVSVGAGDLDRDGEADLVVGAGAGGGPHVRCVAADGTELMSFFAGEASLRAGVRVACAEVGGPAILATVPGTARVGVFDAAGRSITTTPLAGGATLGGLAAAAGNAATAWADVLLRTVAADKTAPPLAARNMAMTFTAVHDAVNAVTGRYAAYHFTATDAAANPDVAAAAAAHRVLSSLYPTRTATFDAAFNAQLALVPEGDAKSRGVVVGRAAADDILALRAGDLPAGGTYTPGPDPGDWVPTPPGFLPYALPAWGTVRPFALASGSQFRPSGPPALDGAAYAAAWDEVRRLGAATGSERTADQTQAALFWAAGGGTVTPPGMNLRIAADLAERTGLDLADTARALALVGVAVADAGIVAWDAKRAFEFWRPVTAIQRADTDGNAATTADPSWTSLLTTPNFPDYTSGHSTFSSAAAAVLEAVFGPDVSFRTSSDSLPDVSRAFDGFEDAAAEAGRSRIYGGIHYEFANQDALASGRRVGEVVAGLLKRG